MKIIISQDGQQIFTCEQCQEYSIGNVEIPGNQEGNGALLYSVGVDGMSLGQFEDETQAESVFKEIAAFLVNEDTTYTVPIDAKASIGNRELDK